MKLIDLLRSQSQRIVKVGYEFRHYASRSLNRLGNVKEVMIPRGLEVPGLVMYEGGSEKEMREG